MHQYGLILSSSTVIDRLKHENKLVMQRRQCICYSVILLLYRVLSLDSLIFSIVSFKWWFKISKSKNFTLECFIIFLIIQDMINIDNYNNSISILLKNQVCMFQIMLNISLILFHMWCIYLHPVCLIATIWNRSLKIIFADIWKKWHSDFSCKGIPIDVIILW